MQLTCAYYCWWQTSEKHLFNLGTPCIFSKSLQPSPLSKSILTTQLVWIHQIIWNALLFEPVALKKKMLGWDFFYINMRFWFRQLFVLDKTQEGNWLILKIRVYYKKGKKFRTTSTVGYNTFSSPSQKCPKLFLLAAIFFYLKTIGAGTQNLISIFLMLSCSAFSSRYHEVWSLADAPAVGSGAPQTELMAEGWDPSSSSKSLWAVGKICWGSSLIKYCANFCSCSRRSLDRDSETGALNVTRWGCNIQLEYC